MAAEAKPPMRVRLERIGKAAFEVEGGTAGCLVVDGSPEIGGEGRGMRPMELLLAAVASCSAMDVVHILGKQREPLEGLSIEVSGARAEGTPSPFERIEIVFCARGPVDEHKLRRAVGLAVEKYCSVGATLAPGVEIRWEARLDPS